MPEMQPDLRQRCNDQIDHELHASHLYLAMSAWFEARDFPGMAAWMRGQSEEEREHAMKFYEHLAERGETIVVGAIDEPRSGWDSPLDAFRAAYEHEKKVTQQIYEIYQAAEAAGDYALQVFLNWFVEEQVEEEHSTEHIVNLLERISDDAFAVWKLDRELALRDAE